MANAGRFAALGGVGSIFTFIGICNISKLVFVACFTTLIGYIIIQYSSLST